MEGRVSALETHMEYVRKDLGEIKTSLQVLPTLATKADVTNWKIQWTALMVAALAVIIGSIIGGLGWLETRASRVQAAPAAAAPQASPIIINVPPTASAKR